MAPNSLKVSHHAAHGAVPFTASVARRGATRPHDLPNKPDALLGAIAVRQLFRRWPLVPTRELERIRHVLIHCDELGSADTHHLSEPAKALLELITNELERRRRPEAVPTTPATKESVPKGSAAKGSRAVASSAGEPRKGVL
ncbi:hypothetical protein AB0N65_10485 [Paenarthrobacter sp. NPDC089322]|uniref:hypothetical protein n=1 Tax=Paenarthrobacter sp. NPDC089322 TaxID=3155065 RepID=UPI00342D9E2E